MANDRRYRFAYYCSGHGFGHATRVVALTQELLARSHSVHLCTNAPEHVFQSVISAGASYRHAEIDAGIVQPKAYDVARRKTIEGLRRFLDQREVKLVEEVAWLKEIKADAVLVDAPFLPCAAAARVGIPSAIVSNFTFDSCYSYLSVPTRNDNTSASLSTAMQGAHLDEATSTLQVPTHATQQTASAEDDEPPIPAEELAPLVNQVIEDYSNASLLLRLPGCIPIPSFDTDVPMPAAEWTDLTEHSFQQNIMSLLARDPLSIPTCCEADVKASLHRKRRRRKVVDVPLIARPLAPNVYSTEKRKEMLSSLGVPPEQHDPATTKILVVSFGGQSIPKPAASRSPSPQPPHENSTLKATTRVTAKHAVDGTPGSTFLAPDAESENMLRSDSSSTSRASTTHIPFTASNPAPQDATKAFALNRLEPKAPAASSPAAPRMQRLMTQDHLYLPGAPPALHRPAVLRNGQHRRKISIEIPKDFRSDEGDPSSLEQEFSIPDVTTTTATDANGESHTTQVEELLPRGWIAIVCGISGKEAAEDLPENFYAAPRDIYVPDLTAICDVLLGKLGYGTCSETVSTQTPFLYVPRPLFVEEFGLKRLMEQSGTALSMTRAEFEAGHWARLIESAYALGRDRKEQHIARQSSSQAGSSAATSISCALEEYLSVTISDRGTTIDEV